MNLFDNLALGLATTVQWHHVLLLLGGLTCGGLAVSTTRIGLLAMLAMLLPVVQQLDMLPALMLMVGVYCGANGGVFDGAESGPGRVPNAGAPPAAVNAADRGGGLVIGRVAPLVALLAGLIGTAVIVAVGPLLIEQAFRFGPAEYFSLLGVGLMASVVLAPGSSFKAMATLVLGVLLSQIGVDPASGLARFDFEQPELEPGLNLIPIALGLAVVARVSAVAGVGSPRGWDVPGGFASPQARFQTKYQWPQLVRGAAIGSLLGTLPGGVRLGGHVAATVEGNLLRSRGAVGVDAIDGASAPAALAAAVRSSLVPLLALGFPVNASLALLAGVMFAKQVVVGPQLMSARPELFWGAIAALVLSSGLLFVVGRPLGRFADKSRHASPVVVAALMVIWCSVGAYTVRNAVFDIFVMAAFAVLGHGLFKFGCRVGPLIVGFVLGPALESNLRHALELSGGNWGVLVTRPISAGLLLVAVGFLLAVMLPSLRLRRARIFDQED